MLPTPRPGTRPQDLAAALEACRIEADNIRAAVLHARGLQGSYVRWARTAVERLRHLIASDDIDALILTRRYWAIHSVVDQPVWMRGLIEQELDERVIALGSAVRALKTQIGHWERISGAFVVVDTSVFLRAPEKVDELPWAARLDLRHDDVHLLVPMVVIDELDRLKQSGDQKIRWRSSMTLAVIDRVLGDATWGVLHPAGSVRTDAHAGRVSLEVVVDPVGHVRLPIEDDEIIDRALAISSFVTPRDVTLLTYDTGQRTRAVTVGLRAVKLTLPIGDEPRESTRRGTSRRRDHSEDRVGDAGSGLTPPAVED